MTHVSFFFHVSYSNFLGFFFSPKLTIRSPTVQLSSPDTPSSSPVTLATHPFIPHESRRSPSIPSSRGAPVTHHLRRESCPWTSGHIRGKQLSHFFFVDRPWNFWLACLDGLEIDWPLLGLNRCWRQWVSKNLGLSILFVSLGAICGAYFTHLFVCMHRMVGFVLALSLSLCSAIYCVVHKIR
jgi:hypothetical protein